MDEADAKWLTTALRYVCNMQNWTAEGKLYGWDSEFRMKELDMHTDRFYAAAKARERFNLSNLTPERCKAIGFGQWSKETDLLLFPLWYVPFIPEGLPVTDIGGESYRYSREKADLDARFGCVAFGISASSLSRKIAV